jgi:hypothetical protein
MEGAIVSRLASLVASGRLGIPAFFKACALIGISFTAAVAAVSGTSAWAKEYAGRTSLPQSYGDFVASDVIRFLADAQKAVAEDRQRWAQQVSPSTNTFSQQSPPPPPPP